MSRIIDASRGAHEVGALLPADADRAELRAISASRFSSADQQS
ncbi:hypothetical protein ACMHYB_59875 [Sorangium sp. So ce1128]